MNSSQSMLMLIGRILVGAIFLVAGIRKALAIGATAGYMAKFGVPMSDLLVYGAVILEIVGGLALILGWQTKAVAWILGIFTAVITPIFHGFWSFPPDQYVGQLNHFLKNLSIIGGLIYVATFGAGAMSVDKR